MRSPVPAFQLAATAATAFAALTAILMSPDMARADDAREDGPRAQCDCRDGQSRRSSRPKYADLRTELDVSDEIATLETLQLALSEVGDGATYVWHRYHGRLSGVIRPTASFKGGSGEICRHLVVVLTSGSRSQRSEGIACRMDDGRWRLEG